MRQLDSKLDNKQRFGTWKRSIGWIQSIGIGALLTLISCSPRNNNASTPNSTDTNSMQTQSSPTGTASSPGSTSPSSTPGSVNAPSDTTLNPNSTSILDNALVVKGAQDNLFEIQAGELANQKATNAEVKRFAQRMVQDHTRATPALEQVASERNITLPTTMGDQNQALLARLTQLSGAEFDRVYMTEMVNSHQQDVALVRNEAQHGKDQTLKTLAADKLPALEEHLRMAQELSQQLNR